MELKSKTITKIHFDVKLDDENVITFDSLRDLFTESYYDYFPHVLKYPTEAHTISYIRHFDSYNNYFLTACYLPLFRYFDKLGIIKLDNTNVYDYPYKVLDRDKLEEKYNEILSFVENTINNMDAHIRDAKLEQFIKE